MLPTSMTAIFRNPYVYTGTSGNDVLTSRYTSAVNEYFYGYEGDDYIDGGLGADRMVGGIGHDSYVVENAGDVVVENANEGFDIVYSSISYTIPANVEKLQLTGTAAINATGSSMMDRLYGNSSSNILWGLDGNDILNGMEGTDTMIGGAGMDTYYVDNAGDVVVEYADGSTWDTVASSISYTLGQNVENLTLTLAGDKDGTGNELDNLMHGNGWLNVLNGLGGNDTILAGNGDDKVFGGTGNDYLDGDWGVDMLVGGIGTDVLKGGYAGDLFVWSSIDETSVTVPTMDRITDFNFAQGDRIDLSGVDANAYAGGNQAFTFIGTGAFSGTPGEINYYHSGGNTIIQMQTGTSADIEGGIVLDGLHTPDATWFVL
jgi:serralysin